MKLDSDYNEPDISGEPIRDILPTLLEPTQKGLQEAPQRRKHVNPEVTQRVELMRDRYERGQNLWTGRRLTREEGA